MALIDKARQGDYALTNAERLAKGMRLPQRRGEGNSPAARRMHYTAETFLARNEKLVRTLLGPPRRPGVLNDDPATRARKARGHILVIANALTHETPAAIMDRLGIAEADRKRIGEFTTEIIWS